VSKPKTQGQQRASHGESPQGGFVQFPLTVASTIEVRFADGTLVSVPAETARAQAQAELSTLTDAAQVLQEDREELRKKIAELQAAVERLTNMLWGRRSEKRINSDQPTLFEFPEHLERRHITLDLDDEAKQGLTLLDVKLFERLRFERPRIYVEVIHRHLYVRPGEPDAGVIARPAPLGILPGVKYDFSIIAAALSMKLNFHQPTYRQQDMFAQAGYFPSRSTLNDWFNYSVIVIEPLFEEAWRLLLQQQVLLGDDTRVRLVTRGALEDEEIEKLQRRPRRWPITNGCTQSRHAAG
jgi:transposase